MRNPGKLQSAFAHHRLRPWFRRARAVAARVPVESKQDAEWEKEVAAMERVCGDIAEALQNTIRNLDHSIRRMDVALAAIAEEKRLTQKLFREMGIGR